MTRTLADRVAALSALWLDSPREDVKQQVVDRLRGPSEREVMQALCCGKYGGCLRGPGQCDCDNYISLNKYGYKEKAHAIMKLYQDERP